MFGEEDPDQDVSPDTADPEADGGKDLFIIKLTYENKLQNLKLEKNVLQKFKSFK